MNRAALLAMTSIFALSVFDSAAAPLGSGYTGYGASASGRGGYDYVRFPPFVSLAPLETQLLAGTFADGDYSTQYALDASGMFVEVDTTTGAVTPIGAFGFAVGVRTSIAADPVSQWIYATIGDADCAHTGWYAINRNTGHGEYIYASPLCIQSIVYDGPGDFLYVLDRDTSSVTVVDENNSTSTTLGPLGISVDDTTSLAIVPGTNTLLLITFEAGTNEAYVVDTVTGNASPVGPLGDDAPISALSLAPPLQDDLFADGFE